MNNHTQTVHTMFTFRYTGKRNDRPTY